MFAVSYVAPVTTPVNHHLQTGQNQNQNQLLTYFIISDCHGMYTTCPRDFFFVDRIGLAIAKRLCQDGAKVMISSRKQKNVDAALQELRRENLEVSGLVCHVAKLADRTKLIDEVSAALITLLINRSCGQ
jgi:hypothetical protein